MIYKEFSYKNYNEALLLFNDDPWKITKFYYASLHAINYVLFPNSFAPSKYSHRKRIKDMELNDKLKKLIIDFEALETLSRISRYDPQFHPMNEEQNLVARDNAEKVLRECRII
jgi:hypothetical protein